MTLTGNETIYTIGFNMGGYSPDPDSVQVAVKAADARLILADMIDRFIDHEAEGLMIESDEAESDSDGWLWDGHAFASAALESLQSGRQSDYVRSNGEIFMYLTDSSGYDHAYWVDETTLRDVYGDDWESVAEYDETARDILDELDPSDVNAL